MAVTEVERKRQVPTEQISEFEARLEKLGYRAAESVTESDTYYSRPDIDYMKTVECLRIRHRGDFAELTYKPASTKENFSDSGIVMKQELNVLLKRDVDAGLAESLLETIGMVRLVTVKKMRRAFTLDGHPNVTVALDELEGVGMFVEVEVMSDDPDAAMEQLEQLEVQLGITGYEVSRAPYRDLVMQAQGSL